MNEFKIFIKLKCIKYIFKQGYSHIDVLIRLIGIFIYIIFNINNFTKFYK